jgi:hypothetical protein
MTPNVTEPWEETLNAYLEGRGLRADAEDLLMRLQLSPSERDQIERSLRLTDELTVTLRQAQLPAGAQGRMLGTLRACPAPAELPLAWEMSEAGMTTAVSTASADEDLLDAAIEGRIPLSKLVAMRDAGQLSESAVEALEALQGAAETVADLSPGRRGARGMVDRLRTTLENHMTSKAGELDAKVVDRLLAKPGQPQKREDLPDVIAAEEEPGED